MPAPGSGMKLSRSIGFFLVILITAACSGTGSSDDITILAEEIHGFFLGEKMEDLFERVQYKATWKEVSDQRVKNRGELYEFSRLPDGSREIDHARLAFLDGRLMEIVIYYRQNNVIGLMALKDKLEKKYGVKSSSPDGTREMAYKTYWLKGPGMSITIRRITKRPETELYVQYIHSQLHRNPAEKQ